MKRLFIGLTTFLLIAVSAFADDFSNTELLAIMEADTVTSAMAVPYLNAMFETALPAGEDKALTIGEFSKMVVEMGLVEPSLLYKLTKWSRYSAQTLVFYEIVPEGHSWNRTLSGPELIEYSVTLSELNPQEEGGEE